ncbi:aspartate 1-decarboxylase [Goodfellowiella coeruleoviolacea]|uniref:L-aspartate 1-decarboxylase n=1 Tax=Goodfellowiella coeruleoviolacea TaxID=334858 RepID=A0AAE3G9L5_9PSEU|nr:aspartate 1-decarboxylase [Goodfellowiella coeruleoviolacea]MCP2163272.1 L-aspartate 1-decarboxylase [Goodfellowiella coeruleoviolacea]
MSGASPSYLVKRSCLHNVRVTSSVPFPTADIPEGLVLPRTMMEISDFVPYEQVVVTKIGGDNWVNRMYTFVLPGDSDEVEARGSVAHLLGVGDVCCAISRTTLNQRQYEAHVADASEAALLDVRFYPERDVVNDYDAAKIVVETGGRARRVDALPPEVVDRRRELPRTLLSNLLANLEIQEVERRGCIEMSAELPVEYMRRAGFCVNQSIFVYNASRGGTSAESYVVPSLTKRTVGISGALSAVADVGDKVSEAAYVNSTELVVPTVCNLLNEPVLSA